MKTLREKITQITYTCFDYERLNKRAVDIYVNSILSLFQEEVEGMPTNKVKVFENITDTPRKYVIEYINKADLLTVLSKEKHDNV